MPLLHKKQYLFRNFQKNLVFITKLCITLGLIFDIILIK